MNDLTPSQQVTHFVKSLETPFQKASQFTSVNWEQEAHFACQALVSNDFLMNVAIGNKRSLQDAILNVAAIGLTLNPVSQLAYLIPRNGKVCLDISYKGLIRTATDSGSIVWAQAEIVREKDSFNFMGIGEKPEHKYNPFSKERGEIVGAYVVAKTVEGEYLTTMMNIDEIYSIRDKSESWKKESRRKYSPWFNFEGEMIKKTVIRRASKTWPRTDKIFMLEKAVDISHNADPVDLSGNGDAIDLQKDFPQPKDELEIGSRLYRILYGKFRNKQLEEIDEDDLIDYSMYLEEKQTNGKLDAKYTEILTSINLFLQHLDEIKE